MPTTLVVIAHPDRRSFTGAWAQASIAALKAKGDRVLVSDLSTGFDAVEAAHHHPDWPAGESFDALKAQERLTGDCPLPPDIAAEVEKLEAADRVIFHFPIWWFAPPAVLKGWCDRVFLHGRTHDVDNRFDTGLFRGRQALFCVSTGSSAAESSPSGKEGDIRLLLWPLAQTLRYLGFTVLEPELVHGVHGYWTGEDRKALETRLGAVLARQADLLADWNARPEIPFNTETDFDDRGQLRPDAPSYGPFIRHGS